MQKKNEGMMKNTDPQNKIKKIIIVGLPNTGKSHVFNSLTGEYTLVGNYPFTTVEINRGESRIKKEKCEIIDTPGLHSLYIHSEEELVVRDLIFSENPDVIIQCIDANRLKQSLTLTADLLELEIPLVVALNSINETSRRGMRIDTSVLSDLLGVPVAETDAVDGTGLYVLKNAVKNAGKGHQPVRYNDLVEDGITKVMSAIKENAAYRRKISILLLQNDSFLPDQVKKIYGTQVFKELEAISQKAIDGINANIGRLINFSRNKWIEDVVLRAVKKEKSYLGGYSENFGWLCRHPVFGVPILFSIIFMMYFLVVDVANVLAGWMEQLLWLPVEDKINALVPAGLLNDFLIGHYGVLSLGLANAFITVLPILSVFFLAFNILEDIGYIPNVCVLTKRFFEKIGLSGSSIMPLVLGFGCKTMATLTTRSIRSKRERYIAIYLIAFAIPCAAQLGLNMSILGRMGLTAFVIAFSVLAFVEITAGIILNNILKKEKQSDFIQELPKIRLPSLKAVLKKTFYRLYWFLKEAVPVFVYASVTLFLVDLIGLLNVVKELVRPVMEGFLGLPVQMVDALILCMARHEAAAALIINLVERGQLNYVQCIVAVTITTMFVPCFANIVAMIKELGMKKALIMVVTINLSAFVLAGTLNHALKLFF